MNNLVISKLYKEDTLSAYSYIKNVLKAPMAAKSLKKEIKEKLIYIIEPQPSPQGEGSTLDDIYIKIVRFLYCKRDWMNILKEKTVEEMM